MFEFLPYKLMITRKFKEGEYLFYLGIIVRRFWLFLWISSLVLAAIVVGNSGVQAQGQDAYSLQLQGFVWNHSALNALVITSDNESWWNPAYLNATLRAIGQWNDAITAFATNYSDFSYLDNLRIQTTVSNTLQQGFDIYVNWTDSSLSNITDEAGLSQIFPSYDNTIINCTTILTTHTNHGSPFSEVDMQNLALHEFGHNLGLGHCNYTGDLMYPVYNIGSPPEAASSLDVYAIATLFVWELNPPSFYPVSNWLTENSVILPPTIPYQSLAVSPQNAAPQTLANNSVVQFFILIFEILIHPDILAIVIVVAVIFVIIALIPRRRKM
jgi:hypothetical protein